MISSLLLGLAMVCQARLPAGPLTAAPVTRPVERTVKPDVLLVILDDVGFSDFEQVHAAGYLPNLWALAGQGFRFLNATSNPICSPTRRSIYTGQFYAKQSGVPCEPVNALTPPDALSFLPQSLASVGYTSALVGKWHVGRWSTGAWEEAPLHRGFDYWRGGSSHAVFGCGGHDYNNWRMAEDGSSVLQFGPYNPTVARQRFEALWPVLPGPRFAVYASNLAHSPYHRPPSSLLPGGSSYPGTPTDRLKYEAMIAALDVQMGQILANVNLATTVVIVVSDNGTPEDVAADPTHAKKTTFQGGVHVPFFMVGAGIPSGETYALVHVADIFATVCELAVGTPPAGLDSRSLMPLVNGTATKVHDYVASGVDSQEPLFDKDLAARSLRYKLRRVTDKATQIQREEFFDLLTDPGEQVDLITDPTLQSKIAAHRAVIDAEFP